MNGRGDEPIEVAIATTAVDAYDAYLPALAREAGLPIFCTHGLPALDSGDGRACAALADALLRGPTQERMRHRRTAGAFPGKGMGDPSVTCRHLTRTTGAPCPVARQEALEQQV